MRSLVVLTLALSLRQFQQPQLSQADMRRVIELIIDYRVTGFEDRTPINFCDVPEFWSRRRFAVEPECLRSTYSCA